jgi:hypothetical protein
LVQVVAKERLLGPLQLKKPEITRIIRMLSIVIDRYSLASFQGFAQATIFAYEVYLAVVILMA